MLATLLVVLGGLAMWKCALQALSVGGACPWAVALFIAHPNSSLAEVPPCRLRYGVAFGDRCLLAVGVLLLVSALLAIGSLLAVGALLPIGALLAVGALLAIGTLLAIGALLAIGYLPTQYWRSWHVGDLCLS